MKNISSFETNLNFDMCNFFVVYEGRMLFIFQQKGRGEVEWRFSFNSGRRGSVTGYQVALDYCLDLMESFELKSLFIQAVKKKLARSSFILMQV